MTAAGARRWRFMGLTWMICGLTLSGLSLVFSSLDFAQAGVALYAIGWASRTRGMEERP